MTLRPVGPVLVLLLAYGPISPILALRALLVLLQPYGLISTVTGPTGLVSTTTGTFRPARPVPSVPSRPVPFSSRPVPLNRVV